jgi:hypothetical protein
MVDRLDNPTTNLNKLLNGDKPEGLMLLAEHPTSKERECL